MAELELEVESVGTELVHTEGGVYINYVEDFVGASDSAAGKNGLVPAPARYQGDYVLLGDGNWRNVKVGGHADASMQVITLEYDYVEEQGGGAVLNTKVMSSVTIPSATDSKAGLMSAEDKDKLDDISGSITVSYEVIDGDLTVSLT